MDQRFLVLTFFLLSLFFFFFTFFFFTIYSPFHNSSTEWFAKQIFTGKNKSSKNMNTHFWLRGLLINEDILTAGNPGFVLSLNNKQNIDWLINSSTFGDFRLQAFFLHSFRLLQHFVQQHFV